MKKIKKEKLFFNRKDNSLEEHILKLIEQLEKKPKEKEEKTLDKNLEKEEIIKVKKKEIKGKVEYSRFARTEYFALEKASIYSQILISAFTGFIYKSNVRTNDGFYHQLESERAGITNEQNMMSSKEIDDYSRKFTLNFLFGANVNDISIEEKEKMFFTMYDPVQKQIYLAKVNLLGFGHEKTMHAPMDN